MRKKQLQVELDAARLVEQSNIRNRSQGQDLKLRKSSKQTRSNDGEGLF